jgi:hypothetical protein
MLSWRMTGVADVVNEYLIIDMENPHSRPR